MQTPPQPLPEPQPHMSNRNWILDRMEEMNFDDDHEHNLGYASYCNEESPNPIFEVER